MSINSQENWLQQAIRRTEDDGGRTSSLVLAMVIIVAVIGALYLAQASRTAGAGRRLQELESQREQLELQNEQLRAEIAALRSVPRLIREAERLGYRQASVEDVYYLAVESLPGPLLAQEEDFLPEEEVVLPTYDESLESWLFIQLSDLRERWQTLFSPPVPADEPQDQQVEETSP
jgi:outer membrane murein-binding lipoprotein Lpp